MRSYQKTFWTIRTVELMVLIEARSSGRLMPALTLWNVSTFLTVAQNKAEFKTKLNFFVLLYFLHLKMCHVREKYRFDEMLKNSE